MEKGGPPKEEPFDLQNYLRGLSTEDASHGIHRPKMGVIFKNLTVVGEGADASSIATNWSFFTDLARKANPFSWFRTAQRGTDFNILSDLNGFVKDGEMLLVLGRPGAGCSSFLRVMANDRAAYKSVWGQVLYGGIPSSEFSSYLGEAIYTAEEDVHFPTLTVKQTLTFALRTKTPGKRVPNTSKERFMRTIRYLLTNLTGLTKQMHTLVGNEFIRGLSGGERKRMTIAEAMTARAAINCWDCTTRGLDAASALDYTKSLRIMSDTLQKTTIATFYQASEDMYNLFDKVLILDKGRCIFFGPVSRAKAYFEEMGFECEHRKSTPDFLTGITNASERIVKAGFEGQTPNTPAELEERFKKSADYQRLCAEQAQYEEYIQREQPAVHFRRFVDEKKMRGADGVYTTNMYEQVKALTIREFQLIWGDKAALFGKMVNLAAKGFLYATVFLNMPFNADGLFLRGSALYVSTFFNAMISLSELPNAMRGRRILQKHKSYAMYHPSAYHLANIVSDIPITFIQVLIYSLCCYFIFGLDLVFGKFVIFVFTLFLTSLCMTDVFRLCGNLANTYFTATQTANFVKIIGLMYMGFMIPYEKMHPWFIWFFWINPMSYSYRALFANELKGLEFDCAGSGSVVPRGPGYVDPMYQACTIKGQRGPGDLVVSGEMYLKATYDFETSQRAINIIAVFLFWLLFIVLNCIAMEYANISSAGYTKQVYKKGKAPKQNEMDAPVSHTARRQSNLTAVHSDLPSSAPAPAAMPHMDLTSNTIFTWQDLVYTVPIKGGKKQLLDHISGWIKPKQICCLMGSSGAGKTTLMDVLARRKTIGTVDGSILLNGQPLNIEFERITGYVEQTDVHNPGLTVREALQFSARMRQDPSIPLEEKYAYVEQVLEMMEMSTLGDALIGSLDSGLGISVEERKRLTIGMELVGKPHILFLDEPTSGLDAQSSYNIVKFLRRLADAGMPLVCTIHQPSPILFEHFDRLLLLARGGKTVYFGDIGKNSETLLNYFQKNGARPCGDEENPAEYILQVIGAGTAGTVTTDYGDVWKTSPEAKEVETELGRLRVFEAPANTQPREFATSEWYQFKEVYKRLNVIFWRDPTYNMGRFVNALFVGLLTGFSFWKIGDSSSDVQARIFSVFCFLYLGNSIILLAQPQFMKQRAYFRREYASKFYGWRPFALSIVLVELPYLILCAVLVVVAAYWTAGLDTTSERGALFWLYFVVYIFFAVSFGQAIAAACSTLVQAAVMNPFLASFLMLFSGVLTPPQNLIKFWRSWMYPLDPYRYFLEGVITDILHDRPIHCSGTDLISIAKPPSVATCGAYMADFLNSSELTGYVDNPNSAGDTCYWCPYRTGDDFYASYGWSYSNRWRNLGIFIAYWVFNVFLVVVLTYAFRKPRR
ncbi:ABC-2 type transporter-domain-containing protein [Gaertneriomyces semiglobifer]|nr:ABC-2 type transporter-domain-containing protein [Gaertneriomyces semiglobifer]